MIKIEKPQLKSMFSKSQSFRLAVLEALYYLVQKVGRQGSQSRMKISLSSETKLTLKADCKPKSIRKWSFCLFVWIIAVWEKFYITNIGKNQFYQQKEAECLWQELFILQFNKYFMEWVFSFAVRTPVETPVSHAKFPSFRVWLAPYFNFLLVYSGKQL